jgi:hypothetical protein
MEATQPGAAKGCGEKKTPQPHWSRGPSSALWQGLHGITMRPLLRHDDETRSGVILGACRTNALAATISPGAPSSSSARRLQPGEAGAPALPGPNDHGSSCATPENEMASAGRRAGARRTQDLALTGFDAPLALRHHFFRKFAPFSHSCASIPQNPTGSWEPVGLWMNRPRKRDNGTTFPKILVK